VSRRVVALDLPGGAAFVEALQHVWDAGDAALPLDPRLPERARAQLLDAVRPHAVIGADGVLVTLDDGAPTGQDGDALVVATWAPRQAPKVLC